MFAENADAPGTWYRRFFRYAADTAFDVSLPEAFTCRVGRWPTRPAKFLINHWLTAKLPARAAARSVNSAASLLNEAHHPERKGLALTFIATNFTTIGDLVPTVAATRDGPISTPPGKGRAGPHNLLQHEGTTQPNPLGRLGQPNPLGRLGQPIFIVQIISTWLGQAADGQVDKDSARPWKRHGLHEEVFLQTEHHRPE